MEVPDENIVIVLDSRYSYIKQIDAAIPSDNHNPAYREQAIRIVRQSAAVCMNGVCVRYPNNIRRCTFFLVYKRC